MKILLAFALVSVCLSAHAQSIEMRKIAITGDVLPGMAPGESVEHVGTPAISPDGDLGFVVWIQGEGITPENNSGIWRIERGGQPDLVARAGEQAPGVGAGITLIEFRRPAINSDGRLAFNATLAGPGIDTTNDVGIWSDATTQQIELVARLGDQAPGTTPGTVFSSFGNTYALANSVPRMNEAGTMAFTADLAGPSVTTLNDSGYWMGNAGALELIAREGDQLPGFAPGFTIASVSRGAINNFGELTTIFGIAGPGVDATNNAASFIRRGGSDWQMYLRRGDQAPGMPEGVFITSFGSVAINDAGQIAFHCRFEGLGFDDPGDGADWHETSTGELTLIGYTNEPAPGFDDGTYLKYLDYPGISSTGASIFHGYVRDGASGTTRWGLWRKSGSQPTQLLHIRNDQVNGLPAGVLFNNFSSYSQNNTEWYCFAATLIGTGVDTSNNESYWFSRGRHQELLVIRKGEFIDVDPDPNSTDLREAVYFSILGNHKGESGGKRGMSDRNELAFRVEFADGSIGAFVYTLVCPADVNRDGILTPGDFTAWIAAFNAITPACDQNGDELCTSADFTAWIANYNAGCD